MQSNADYAAYRLQHGEHGGVRRQVGQAISYRFKRDGKGWRVFVSTRMMDVPVVTDRRGTIGVDLGPTTWRWRTDASGNYINAWRYRW